MQGLNNRLSKLEKVIKPVNKAKGNFIYCQDDWTFEEMIQLITNPTPELIEKNHRTDTGNWKEWLSKRTDEELKTYIRVVEEKDKPTETEKKWLSERTDEELLAIIQEGREDYPS